jgi:hypothetical protein
VALNTSNERKSSLTRRPYASSSGSIWPDWAQRLFRALAEIPWGSLTAIAIVSGAALQFAYYRSIQYAPTDFLAITSLAAATAAAALLMAVGIGMLIAFPSIATRIYEEEQGSENPLFTPTELVCVQIAAAAFVVTYFGYENAADCQTEVGNWVFASAGIGFIGLIATIDQVLIAARGRAGMTRFGCLSFVGLMGFAPVLALLPLVRMIKGPWLDSSLFLFSMWLLLMIFNAWMTSTRAKAGGMLLAGGALAVVLYVLLPISLDKTEGSLAAVAKFMGVRSEGPVTLLLAEQGCKLVAAATKSHSTGCSSSEPNAVEATVLSNIGSRWVLALRLNTLASGKGVTSIEEIHVTVPADGVQVVTRKTPTRPRAACARA